VNLTDMTRMMRGVMMNLTGISGRGNKMKKIKDLAELYKLAEERKAVVCPTHPAWKKPHPAAFVINL